MSAIISTESIFEVSTAEFEYVLKMFPKVLPKISISILHSVKRQIGNVKASPKYYTLPFAKNLLRKLKIYFYYRIFHGKIA